MPVPPHRLLPRLRRLTSPEADSDETLLARFARARDEDAFAALVGRYGRLVLSACLRVLRDPQRAQDAAQATWLLLAGKAGAIRRPARLSGWLYGVARRMALRSRRGESRRVRREQRAASALAARPRPDPLDELTARELLLALDEEIEWLPEAHRLAVVLCCLEGLSQEEAARRLGWTPGQVKGRLERGRQGLHARLARRGLTLPAVLGAAEVARATGSAALPTTTIQAARLLAAGETVPAGLVPAHVIALTQGVQRAMFLTKVKAVTATLVLTALACCGIGLAVHLASASGGPGDGPSRAGREQAPPKKGPRADGRSGAGKPGVPEDPQPAGGQAARPKERTPADLIQAALGEAGHLYPAVPTLPTALRGQVAEEIQKSAAVRAAYAKLDAGGGKNTDWFGAVAELEKAKAVWCLVSCLCHPSTDVQIRTLHALRRLGDKRVVPFLLIYAEYMAVLVKGSENATIHGIVMVDSARTLSSLTGVEVAVRGQDVEALRRGIRRWHRWLGEQKE